MRPSMRSTRSHTLASKRANAGASAEAPVELTTPLVATFTVEEQNEPATEGPIDRPDACVEKKARHRMTGLQLKRLEALFKESTHPNRRAKEHLANETGMELKTVTVWFQNRRQNRRKKRTKGFDVADSPDLTLILSPNGQSRDEEVTSQEPPTDSPSMPHPPILAGPGTHAFIASTYRGRSQAGSGTDYQKSSSVFDAFSTIPPRLPSLPFVLEGSIPYPPHTPLENRLTKTLRSEAFTQTGSPGGSSGSGVSRVGEKRKRSLEWACARQERDKRLRTESGCPNTPDLIEDSDSEPAEDEETSNTSLITQGEDQYVHINSAPEGSFDICCQFPVAGFKPTASYMIPSQYCAGYSEDVVLGASLLLEFKYSAGFTSRLDTHMA